MKLQLIPEWKRAHRMASIVACAVLAVMSMAQADVLPLIGPLVPAEKWPWVSGSFAAVIGLLRLLKQYGLLAVVPTSSQGNGS